MGRNEHKNFERLLRTVGWLCVALAPAIVFYLSIVSSRSAIAAEYQTGISSAIALLAVVVAVCIFIAGWYVRDDKRLKLYAEQRDELLKNAPDGILGVDTAGRISFVNARIEDMFGYTMAELKGESVEILLPISLRSRHQDLRENYMKAPTGRAMSTTKGLVGRRKDGRELPVDIALGFHKLRSEIQITAFIRDVTERNRLEQEMQHRAYHDALTGLPNRALLQDRLERAMTHTRRSGTGFALIMVDLDNFKDINDGWGHSLGDQLLVMVARRLTRLLRQGDTVARFGGDEFVILATELSDGEGITHVVNKILSALCNVFVIDQHQLSITVSIGVAGFPEHATDSETLLSYADIALYAAKSSGRSIACYFDEAMGLAQQQSLQLKSRLKSALENEEFIVFYQPQYSIKDDSIIGFEALLRWHHPESGWVEPGLFIPMAESSGLVIPMTEWILRQVFAQLSIWIEMGIATRISVNISALHFQRDGVLRSFLEELLHTTGIDPTLLGLELTETALMDNPDVAADTLRRVADMGIHISIDDFGTGYSSLALLRVYPLHTLKIDRSFMIGLEADSKSVAIVRGLVNLAGSLNMQVLAEGVETETQYEILKACCCDAIQGWLKHPAMPSLACTELLLLTTD